jgi:hypothetical protein
MSAAVGCLGGLRSLSLRSSVKICVSRALLAGQISISAKTRDGRCSVYLRMGGTRRRKNGFRHARRLLRPLLPHVVRRNRLSTRQATQESRIHPACWEKSESSDFADGESPICVPFTRARSVRGHCCFVRGNC